MSTDSRKQLLSNWNHGYCLFLYPGLSAITSIPSQCMKYSIFLLLYLLLHSQYTLFCVSFVSFQNSLISINIWIEIEIEMIEQWKLVARNWLLVYGYASLENYLSASDMTKIIILFLSHLRQSWFLNFDGNVNFDSQQSTTTTITTILSAETSQM